MPVTKEQALRADAVADALYVLSPGKDIFDISAFLAVCAQRKATPGEVSALTGMDEAEVVRSLKHWPKELALCPDGVRYAPTDEGVALFERCGLAPAPAPGAPLTEAELLEWERAKRLILDEPIGGVPLTVTATLRQFMEQWFEALDHPDDHYIDDRSYELEFVEHAKLGVAFTRPGSPAVIHVKQLLSSRPDGSLNPYEDVIRKAVRAGLPLW